DMRETPRCWTVAEKWTEPSLNEYYEVINEILAAPVTNNQYGEAQRRTLYLSAEAFEQHKSLFNTIQQQLVRYGGLAPIKDLSEKTPEHACRIAATLAFAENPKAEVIGADHYRGAIDLMRHYVCEALRLKFWRTPDEMKRRADELLNWLKQLHAGGQTQIDARTIQRSSPRSAQCRVSVDEVLKVVALLQERGYLRPVELDGSSRRAKSWEICLPRQGS